MSEYYSNRDYERESDRPVNRTRPANRPPQNGQRRPSQRNSRQAMLRRKRKKFRKMLFAYIAVLVVILIAFMIFFSGYLKAYESSRPVHVAEGIVENFQSSQKVVDFIVENQNAASILGDVSTIAESYAASIEGKQIGFRENTDFRPDSPSYDITADNMTVAKVTLSSSETVSYGNPVWEISQLNITDYLTDAITITVQVPEGSTVYVNGSALDRSYIQSTDIPEVLQASTDYISSPPVYDSYKVGGFVSLPTVTAVDANGADLTINNFETDFVASYTTQEFIDSVYDRVRNAVSSYATYFIHETFDLSNYIIYGTDLYLSIFGGDGQEGINTDFYNWEHIVDYEFTTLEVSNIIQYADDCFTADISWALDITYDDPSYEDNAQQMEATWVFVPEPLNNDGSWCVSQNIYK